MIHRYLSRSAMVNWHRCKRFGYLNNVYGGLGITPVGKSAPLAIGSANHAGVQHLMLALKQGGDTDSSDVDTAVHEAIKTYDQEAAGGISDVPERFIEVVKREHHAIIEVAVKLFAAVRLPVIAEKYEVLEVEHEHTIKLSPYLTLVSRPDAVFEDRFSGMLDVFSLKNPGKFDYRKNKDATVDMQGLSESYAVQYDYPNHIVNSVMMEHILVGMKGEADLEDGTVDSLYPIKRTPLVRGWMRTVPGTIGATATYEIAWRYKYDNVNFDPTKPRKTGNFRQTSLSSKQGWAPVVAYEHPEGVDGWFRDLIGGRMVPRELSPIGEIFVAPPPYIRRQEHIDEWLESTIYEQTEISEKIEAHASGQLTINQAFPKSENACMYPQKCDMYEICWKGASPDDRTKFVPRTPHHEQELLPPEED